MDDAVRDVLALLNDLDESSDDCDLIAEPYHALIEQIRELKAPAPTRPHIPPITVTVPIFDEDTNMLDAKVRDALRRERIFEETELFTEPLSTTNTMAGYLTNVSFHESEFIQEVVPDDRIVMYHCNFGTVIYPGYTPPPRRAVGTRKKKTSKKPRKKQGDGSAFNSQMTFVVRSGLIQQPEYDDELGYAHVPTDTPVYKIKIFRTGVVQLPGALTHKMDDVIDCVQYIVGTLNLHFHPGEEDPALRTRAINTNPVMKNYKFALKMPENYILDTTMLKRMLLTRPHDDIGVCVFDVKYTRRDTKLSVRFSTPIPRRAKKRTCVNIFMRGRINILGAFDAATTRLICEYLHMLFVNNRDVLIVPEGGIVEPSWSLPYVQNVETPSDQVIAEILERQCRAPFPNLDDALATEVLNLIDEIELEIERGFYEAIDEIDGRAGD